MKSFTPFFPFTLIALAVLVAVDFIFGLSGCQSTPSSNQQVATTVLIDAAVGVAVQNGTSDQAVWSARASQITSIAKQLQALDTGATATLPALTSALQPLLAKANLGPADQLAANVLITALGQIIQQNVGNVNTTTQQVIQQVLSDVISAASVYVPANS